MEFDQKPPPLANEQRQADEEKSKESALPDMADFWQRFPSVETDSGRFLEEDR